MIIPFKKQVFQTILNIGIHAISKKKNDKFRNWNQYIIGKAKRKIFVVNLDMTLHSLYSIYIYVQRLIKQNGKILFVDRTYPFSIILENIALRNSQFYITNEDWLGGSLTNYTNIRWFYYFKGINIGHRLPEAVVVFDNILSNEVLFEVNLQNIPTIGSLGFTRLDRFVNFFIVGSLENLNSIIFFTKILELAILTGRNFKLKYIRKNPRKSIRVLWKGREYWVIEKKKKKKFKKKRGRFIRNFYKEFKFINKFRPTVQRHIRRVNLTRKLISFYYNWSRTKKKKNKITEKSTYYKK